MNSPLIVRLYRLALRAYPRRMRSRHEWEMAEFFAREWEEAVSSGTVAQLRCAARFAGDFLRTVPTERLAAMTKEHWLASATAVACGLVGAGIDLGAHELHSTALVLFIGTSYFSYLAHKRGWAWPLVVAAWPPLARLVDAGLRGENEFSVPGLLGLSTVALVSCVAGMGVGRRLRRALPLSSCSLRNR